MGISHLGFMSLGQTNVEICNTLCFELNQQGVVIRNIKILLIHFCQESPRMLCAKFGANRGNRLGGIRKSRFATFGEFAGRNGRQKWAWPISQDSARFSEQ